MALPSYEDFVVKECKDVVTAIKRKHRRAPTAGDLYHNAWRRLLERWTHRDILHDILGEALEDGGHGGDREPPPTTPQQPEPPDQPPTTPLEGRIRAYGARSVQDDGWPGLHLTLSDFSLLRLYRADRAAALQRVQEHVSKGFTAARVLAHCAGGSWQGREILASWPDHATLVHDLTQGAYARGLRIEWTLLGEANALMSRQADRLAFVRDMGQALKSASGGVLFVEMCNEPWNNGLSWPDALALRQEFLAASDGLFLTATGALDDAAAREQTQRDVLIAHLDRDTSKSEMQDRPWRQAWECGLEGQRWCDNEPIGHGSSVRSETRPDVLRSHRLVAYIARAFASCLHCTPAGVYAEVPWTDIPAYHEAGKARAFLPGTLPEGQPHNANANFPGRPYDIDASLIRANNGNTRGLVRMYTCELNGTHYTVPFGLVSDIEITARENFLVECYSQTHRECLWERAIARGEVVYLPQATDYLIVSRRS